MDTWITVVTPRVFRTPGPHRVIYMLHGLSGNSSNWPDNTMMPIYAQEHNVMFIMPEVARSFYTDMTYGLRYFSYVSRELPELCKGLFNISGKREDTAIMGASMGGYGALRCALSRPEQYHLCCAFSSGCLQLKEWFDQQRSGTVEIPDLLAAFGPELEWRKEYEILELARKVSREGLKPIVHTTCGTDDFLYEFNARFSKEMKALDLEYAHDEWDGTHDWHFWNESLKRMLAKYY